MICPQYYPFTGGYEKAADRIASKLSELGNVVYVITDMNGQNIQKTEIKNGYTIKRLPSIYKRGLHQISFSFSLFIHMSFILKNYDIIHVHQHGYAGLISILLAKVFNKPIVLKITSTGHLGLKQWLNIVTFSSIISWFYKLFDGYIATSKTMISELTEIGIRCDKIFNLPNPVDTSIFRPLHPDLKKKLKKKLEKINNCLVLYVGRLDINKNPQLLLDAWKKIELLIEDIQLIIVGDGNLYDLLKNRYKSSSVDFIGRIENPLEWYQISDIFVLTSNIEGFSNSLLEALSSGLPVISTKVSGTIDVFEKGEVGLLINPGDSEAMFNSLLLLIGNNDLRNTFGSNARNIAKCFYSLQEIVNSTLSIYMHVISMRKSFTNDTKH